MVWKDQHGRPELIAPLWLSRGPASWRAVDDDADVAEQQPSGEPATPIGTAPDET